MTNHIAARRLRRIRGRARAACEKMTPAVPAAVQAYLRGESIAPAADAGDRPDDERRSCARVSIKSEVLVRPIGGFGFQAGLRDLSTRGCSFELIEPCEVGDSVITRFPQLEPLGSRVCWAEGVTAGVEFATAMHPAVFESVLVRLANGQAATE